MTKNFLAWDLEIQKIPTSPDWRQDRPLGITCAATKSYSFGEILYYGGVFEGNGIYRACMSTRDCKHLVKDLQDYSASHRLVTWNGLGFDFDILAEESGLHSQCVDLALRHYDPMFQFLCYQGYPVSLESVSKGFGLRGKLEEMSGALAPEMWASGEYDRVLEYVARDVGATLEVVRAIEQAKGVYWITQKGKKRFCPFPQGLLCVADCLHIAEPNTSWMTNPIQRKEFFQWTLDQ